MLLRRLTVAVLSLLTLIAAVPASAASELSSKLTAMSAAGSGEATYHLGMLHHLGMAGVPKDTRKAFELFKLATERGDALGAYKLGCYYDGQGEGVVKVDAILAMKYKLVAAEAGYVLAQQDVAQHLFAAGDSAAGLRWLEAAAAQGSGMALMALGSLYAGQLPPEVAAPKVPKNVVKGFAYMLIAARDVPEMRSAFELELAKLPKDEQERVRKAVADWKDRPSTLTQSVRFDAPYKLAGLPVPAS